MYPSSPSLSTVALPGKSYSVSASSRSHGMLVLTRPSPKPLSQPKPETKYQPQPPPQPQHQQQHQSPLHPPSSTPQSPPLSLTNQAQADLDSISLRPLGKTGPGPLFSSSPSPNKGLEREREFSPAAFQKSDKFVPPHLRSGFDAKEAGRPATPPGGGRGRDFGGYRPRGFGSSPNRYGEDRRPKSGGGYEKAMVRRGGGGRIMSWIRVK